jgi:hypothetical protein
MAPKTPGWAARKERCGLKLQDAGSGSWMGAREARKRESLESGALGQPKKQESKKDGRSGR